MLTLQFTETGKLTDDSSAAVSELIHAPGVLEDLMKHLPMPPVDASISPATCELSTSIIGESMKQARIPDIRIELRTKESGIGIDARFAQSNLELTQGMLAILQKIESDLAATTSMPPMHLHFSGTGIQPDGSHSFTLNIYPAIPSAMERDPVGSISFRLTVREAA